jgi:hypothetical protein
MRKIAGLLALAFAFLPQISEAAAELGVDATTLFRFEERAVPGFAKETVVPATQFFTVDLGKTGDGNLSFHLSGWARLDMAERSATDDNPDGDLTYGYLLYTLPQSNAQVKGGRFFIYDAGTVEQIDGLSLRMDLQRGFNASLFGGKPVKQDDFQDNKGNFITGGRIGYRSDLFDAGLSVLHEEGAWSRRYEPGTTTLRTISKYRQLVGADLWAAPLHTLELNGRALYNPVTEEMAEQSYIATWRATKRLSLTADYNRYQLETMFSDGNFPMTMFRPIAGTTHSSYGTAATFTVSKPLEFFADYRDMRYRSAGYGNSKRYGFGARLLLQERIRLGAAYRRLDANRGDMISYDEYHAWGIYSRGSFSTSLDLITHRFDRSLYGRDYAFEATVAAGYQVSPEIGIAGDISYAKTPLMNAETRGVLKVNYNHQTKGAR